MVVTKDTTTEEILAKFVEVKGDPYKSLKKWKEENKKKVIGCFPMYLPEEIIHAAGMLPVVMWESNEPITLGGAYVSPYNCGIYRSVIDDSVKGKLDVLDGMACYNTCLPTRHLLFIVKKRTRFAYLERICLPEVIVGSASQSFAIENLEALKEGLEQFTGHKITDEILKQSILIYNQNRDLLCRLYELRRKNPGLLKAKEVVAIVASSMLMLKEEHNALLTRLLAELEKRPLAPYNKIRIVVSGSLCEAPHNDILDLIEEAGMVIVDDDLYTGSKYFANDVKVNGDPIAALADRYLARIPPCPTKVDYDVDWGDYIIDMTKRNQAQGVIVLIVKYCPPHLDYYADIDKKFKSVGIRYLMLEMEHEVVSLEQVKTRLQAFAETMGVS